MAFFADRYYCVALDLPGHGATAYCDRILAVLRGEIVKMGLPILIGYSMGGRIALQLRGCARALVNLSGHPGLGTQEEREERLRADCMWSEKLLTLAPQEFFTQWYAQPLFHPCTLQSVGSRRAVQNLPDAARVMLQMSLAHQERVVDFPCPALFLYGESDSKYRDLFSRVKHAVTVVEVEHAGHAMHIDNAAGCAQVILKWMGDVCR